jgi:hypothetical protein
MHAGHLALLFLCSHALERALAIGSCRWQRSAGTLSDACGLFPVSHLKDSQETVQLAFSS